LRRAVPIPEQFGLTANKNCRASGPLAAVPGA
jgi:hypothetical protein